MQKILIAATVLAVSGALPAYAQTAPNVQGGTSNAVNVLPGPSDFPTNPAITLPSPPPTGVAGIQMWRDDNTWSDYIPLVLPIGQVTQFATPNSAGPFFARHPLDGQPIAQVWLNNQNSVANVYSLRQVRYLEQSSWPHFGGLVIGQVKGLTGGNVFFGEWAGAVANPSQTDSTNLNMADSSRTVWYVGDNAVSSTPQLVNVTYSVAGIQQTGVGAGNTPYAPDLYNGTLTANYANSGTANQISGSLANSGNTVAINAAILNNGQFIGANTQGRFYNGATALAGIYTGGVGTADDIAFGGHQTGGSINPLP